MSALPDNLGQLAARVRAGDPALAGTLSPQRPVFLRSAPGRVDVLGGLAVEAGGTLAQAALPQRAAVAVQLRDDPLLVVRSEQIRPPVGEAEVAINLGMFFENDHLLPARNLAMHFAGPNTWAAPLAALFYVLYQTPAPRPTGSPEPPVLRRSAPLTGATVVIDSAIPPGAAQAASTAVVTATLAALCDALGLQIDPAEQALYIHRAESLLHPTSNTVLDALTCLHAAPGPPQHLLRYSAQPHTLVGQVALPRDLRIMAFDTGVRYTAAADTVAALRLAGAMGLRIIETIYRDLGQRHTPLHGHLANLSPSLYRQYFRALMPRRLRGADFVRTYGELPERAGQIDPAKLYRVRTAVDHLISEHEHAENFLQAIEELADPASAKAMSKIERELTRRRAGRLMLASHHSYRLRLELSCREADWLIDRLMGGEGDQGAETGGPRQGIYGARISSSGGGGTVVALANRSERATDALLKALSAYSQITSLHLALAEAGAAPGVLHTGPLRVF